LDIEYWLLNFMLSLKENIKEQLFLSPDAKILRLVDKIFNFAIGCEAEEIYFEPRGKNLAVNFRAGGELIDTLVLPGKAEQAVLDGIKSMAGLNDEPRNHPRGSFKKDYLGYKIIFSLNVHDTEAGERIIVNLRKEKFELLGLGRLGFDARALAAVKKILLAGRGLVAVISNDEAARTSVLYGLLNFIKNSELNIATVEEEPAADLSGINQSRINPRAGFSRGSAVNALRRQDIDAAMISEIGDRETAEAAFHLAAAAHLVMAGVAAPDFSAALNFFQDLGAPLSLFSVSAKLAINVTMADKNCPYCLARRKISAAGLARLEKKLALAELLPRLKQDKIISGKINHPADLVFYQSRGCPRCHNSARAGKIGIFEVLEITPAVKDLIKTGHFSALSREFGKQGAYSQSEDALIKALGGLIPLEPVLKLFN